MPINMYSIKYTRKTGNKGPWTEQVIASSEKKALTRFRDQNSNVEKIIEIVLVKRSV